MSTLTPDTAAALDGPDWLRRRRVAAAEQAAAMAMPGPDEEVWRYSRVAELDLDAYRPLADPAPGAGLPTGVASRLDTVPDRAATVVVRNGFVVHAEVAPSAAARGLWVGRLADADGGQALLGAVADEPVDLFSVLNDAFGADPVLVRVPAGVAVEGPIVVVDWLDTAADEASVFPRLVVQAGADSEAAVLLWHASADIHAFVAPVVELDVAPAARLGFVEVQDRGPRVWQIASQVSRVDRDATLVAAQAGLGGDYARARTDCRLVGRGATGNLLAVYFGEREQTLDFRTFQSHVAPDTTSNLLFKGAVGGHSRSVYTGLIKVEKTARGTNAFQTNRNIKLSEHAWAESVPNLEIENNDVRCSHASTVGPIDPEQRFYLEGRGVPPVVAERLIVAGFFDEVLDQLPVPGMAAVIASAIDERLARGGH